MNVSGSGGKKQMAEINVVPYIDVMLVLLVIFMITTPLIKQSVKVELPQAKKVSQINNKKKLKPIEVSVDKNGNYFLSTEGRPAKPVVLKDMAVQVKKVIDDGLKNNRVPPVVVRGDRNAKYGWVVKAMAVLQAAGAPSVGLITEPSRK